MTLHFQDWRGALSNIRLLRGYREPRRNHRSHVRKLSLYVISGVLKWIWDTVILFDCQRVTLARTRG